METTLFNKNGKAVAYIADDGETIFNWDGRAVAYLVEDKVYGWNGKHLGWYNEGTIFDIFGLRSGFVRPKSPIPTHGEPIKPAKQIKPARGSRQMAVSKPVLCYGYSGRSLEEILEEGVS
jgi:hypothetical protein